MGYDVERFMKDLRTTLQNNLPGRLTAITTEKADSIALPAPANASYFLDKYPENGNPSNPWVVILIDQPIEVESVGGTFKQNMSALVAIGNNGMMNIAGGEPAIADTFRRYTRAIAETIGFNFSALKGQTFLKMEVMPYPIPFGEQPGETMLVGAVRVSATIA